jgi:L-alanine-DL-glutamate epimerase-like enolase superfamily enzyme
VTSPHIVALRTRRVSVRMPRPWVPGEPRLHLVVVEVEDSDGAVGTGFSWTPTVGAASVVAMLETEIAPFVTGLPADAASVWPALWTRLHEAGGSGITTIAMAGLDTALWDLDGRRASLTLVDLLGRQRTSVPAYGSGVNLHYSLDELGEQLHRWVERGYSTVKIKVGSPDLATDLERLRLARSVLGPHRRLLVDANQRWTLDAATAALTAFEQFEPGWIEEPLRAEDTRGYAALRSRTAIPIALGENVHTVHRFRDLIDAGFADVLQPNVVRVGGITPFLDIAAVIDESSATLAPHLLIDLSAQLALALPGEVEVEDVEDADFTAIGALASPSPIELHGTRAVSSSAPGPGLGLDFIPSRTDLE